MNGSSLETRVRARMSELDAHGLRRTLRAPMGTDLSSNDYLGLAAHPEVAERMIAAIATGGCGSTGSRLLRGHRHAFETIERAFAEFKNAERAVYFSSGYLANIGVLTALAEPGDVVIADKLNHASLRDAVRLSLAKRLTFPHNDASALARLVDASRGPGQTFVVVESLYSMDGDFAPLEECAAICRRSGALLVVDEAHAVGVYGNRGSGLIEEAGLDGGEFISINAAGKALGMAGAFVAGPAWAIDYLVQRSRPFVFSTAPPPSTAAALHASLDIVVREPERRARLRAISRRLRGRLRDVGVDAADTDSMIIPVVIGDNDRALAVADALQAEGFDVRAIRPPTVPAGTARLRVSVNVRLADAEIDRFVSCLGAALQGSTQWPVASS